MLHSLPVADPRATDAAVPAANKREIEVTRPVLRYHGGKFRLAPWIISHFPAHRIYVEPYGGAAGVLIRKPRAYSEVYNDLDDDVANLFRVIRDPDTRQRLVEMLVLTPYARSEFETAWKPSADPIERARRLVVRAMMGFGSAGATKGTTGFRIDTKREYETAQHTWALYPHNLAAVGQRLSGVLIENRPAIEVIRAHDTPQTLHYIDPPYVHHTRCRVNGKGSARGYRYEMDEADHLALLESLRGGGGNTGNGGSFRLSVLALRRQPPGLGETHHEGSNFRWTRHRAARGGFVAKPGVLRGPPHSTVSAAASL